MFVAILDERTSENSLDVSKVSIAEVRGADNNIVTRHGGPEASMHSPTKREQNKSSQISLLFAYSVFLSEMTGIKLTFPQSGIGQACFFIIFKHQSIISAQSVTVTLRVSSYVVVFSSGTL